MDPQLRMSYDTDLLVLKTLFALDPNTNLPISTNYILSTDGLGGLIWSDPLLNLSTIGTGLGYLPSTIRNLTSNLSSLSSYTLQLGPGLSSLSTNIGQNFTGIYLQNLTSTVVGLGTSGYISSFNPVYSSITGLGTAGYVSTLSMYSSINASISSFSTALGGVVALAGITIVTLTSSLVGLGTLNYISTSGLNLSLTSTTTGLASIGYISTTQLTSTTRGLASIGYISTSQLTSTTIGLATIGYISTSQLTSTVAWLTDPSRYVSSGALISACFGLSNTTYVDRAGNLIITGGTTYISSVANLNYFSSILLSSFTYKGNNGTNNGLVYPNNIFGPNMFFSTATLPLSNLSQYIQTNTNVFLEVYPTFLFPGLNTGASPLLINMSTFVMYGNNILSPTATSYVFAQNTGGNTCNNPFTTPMKIQIPGSLLVNNFSQPYNLCHNLISCITSNFTAGFVNSNFLTRVGSTNSIFVSLQTPP